MTFALLDTEVLSGSAGWSGLAHFSGDDFVVLQVAGGETRDKLFSIAGDVLTIGTDTLLTSGGTPNVQKHSDTLAGLAWSVGGSPDLVNVRGRSSSAGSSSTDIGPGFSNTSACFAAKVSSSRGIGFYGYASYPDRFFAARVYDISDSAVTPYTSTVFEQLLGDSGRPASEIPMRPLAACNLDSSYVVCLVVNDSTIGPSPDGIQAALVNISGTTPSVASYTNLVNGGSDAGNPFHVIQIADNVAIAIYYDSSLTRYRMVKLTRSGGSLSAGTAVTLYDDANFRVFSAGKLITDNIGIIYQRDPGGGNRTYIQSVDVSGTPTLTGDELELVAASSSGFGSIAANADGSRVAATFTSTTTRLYLFSSTLSGGPVGFGLTHGAGGIPGSII